jgi:DNA-binding MarR family transcriptional regulator
MTEELGLADALVRLSHLVQRVFAEVSREHDLTPQQAQFLCRLIGGPVGMADLGRSLHLEKSSLTGLVDRAERRDLVARVRDAHDRRACRVELTDHGASLAAETHKGVTARLETLAGELGAADKGMLTSVIMRILTAQDTSARSIAR